jgi:hypothetical protein
MRQALRKIIGFPSATEVETPISQCLQPAYLKLGAAERTSRRRRKEVSGLWEGSSGWHIRSGARRRGSSWWRLCEREGLK